LTEDEIRTVVRETAIDIFELEPEEIRSNSSFDGDFDVDSLEKLEFIATLEEQFGIHYTASEGRRMNSLDDALTFTQEHM
jgi:acyl carrier protein